jgi:hypothetical protein
MNRDLEIKLGSTVAGRLNAVQMSDSDRRAALNAMDRADVILAGLVWAAKKIEQLGERLFLKPSLKH